MGWSDVGLNLSRSVSSGAVDGQQRSPSAAPSGLCRKRRRLKKNPNRQNNPNNRGGETQEKKTEYFCLFAEDDQVGHLTLQIGVFDYYN